MDDIKAVLVDKVKNCELLEEPYSHIYIRDFLPPAIFDQIVEVATIPEARSIGQLKQRLNGVWKPRPFPGCHRNWARYRIARQLGMPWGDRRVSRRGLALQYYGDSPIVHAVTDAMKSEEFVAAICDKLRITRPVRSSSELQKYLDGYEISPHTDPHAKAATVLVNLGLDGRPAPGMGTKLLVFKPEKKYVETFWRYNSHITPDWVYWDWCEEIAAYDEPNSLLIFAPDERSIHAALCHYDHLKAQRLQIYSDLWYKDDNIARHRASHRMLDLKPDPTLRDRLQVARKTRQLRKISKSESNQ